MTRQRKIFWAGLSIYAASFFLVAVSDPNPLVGYGCALTAFVYPWVEIKDALFHGLPPVFAPFALFSLLVSGWINPIFVLTAFLDLIERYERPVMALRVVIVLMIPFTWFFLSSRHFYPREGHFMWVFGMLLVLFSGKLAPIGGL